MLFMKTLQIKLKQDLTHQINHETNRPLPIGKNKKRIGLMKDELGGNIMTKSVALRPNTYSYLMYDCNTTIKKAKGTKKCVIKRILKFNDYKNCLLNNEVILESQQRFKSEAYNVYSQEINKITLSCNDDKRVQTFDRLTSYTYTDILILYMTQVFKEYVKQTY